MAAEVDAHPGDRVAGRGAADVAGALHERHAVAVAGGAVGRAHPGRARPQDQQVGRRQPPAGTAAPCGRGGRIRHRRRAPELERHARPRRQRGRPDAPRAHRADAVEGDDVDGVVAVVLDALDDRVPAGVGDDPLRADHDLHRTPGLGVQRHRPERRLGLAAGGEARHEVRVADELGHLARGRQLVELGGPALLGDLAAAHHGHLVAHQEGLLLVVGDEERGGVDRRQHPADLDPQLGAQRCVEVGEGLVQQDHRGARGQRPRERHALQLAARERGRHAVLEAGQAHQRERVGDARAAVRGAPRQAVGDVAGDAHVREEGRVLEDHADAAPLGRDEGRRAGEDPVVDADLAGVGALQAGDAAQEGGLAAAARTEQGDQPARRHRQVDAPQHLGGAEGLREAGDRDRLSGRRAALRCAGRFPCGKAFGRPYRPVWRGAIGAIRPAGRTGRRPRGRRSPAPRRRSGW